MSIFILYIPFCLPGSRDRTSPPLVSQPEISPATTIRPLPPSSSFINNYFSSDFNKGVVQPPMYDPILNIGTENVFLSTTNHSTKESAYMYNRVGSSYNNHPIDNPDCVAYTDQHVHQSTNDMVGNEILGFNGLDLQYKISAHPNTHLNSSVVKHIGPEHNQFSNNADIITPENFDIAVEDAMLQADFRQLSVLSDSRVNELEQFYMTQSASIVTQRTDAVCKVEPDSTELNCVNKYYDQQQAHLLVRVAKSLQLLKRALPNEIATTGGTTKKSRCVSGSKK